MNLIFQSILSIVSMFCFQNVMGFFVHLVSNKQYAIFVSDPLRVTLSPKNLKTGISSTLFFTCTVEGSPEYTITWFRNTELIVPDQHISIQGQHNDTLQITAAQKFHSGAYQCFASRKGHTAQDFSIILLEGMWEGDCQGTKLVCVLFHYR